MRRAETIRIPALATLLYVDWLPQVNGPPGALLSSVVDHESAIIDVIFNNKEQFEQMKASGAWNRENLSKLCKIDLKDIDECLVYEPAMAFKCTYQRPISSGAFGDNDIYGSQQHVSLYSFEF